MRSFALLAAKTRRGRIEAAAAAPPAARSARRESVEAGIAEPPGGGDARFTTDRTVVRQGALRLVAELREWIFSRRPRGQDTVVHLEVGAVVLAIDEVGARGR